MYQFLNSQGIYDESVNGIWMVQEGNIMCGSGTGDYEHYIRNDRRDFCIRHNAESNTNELIIDNVVYGNKVANGVNVTVYDNVTNMIVDTFGVNYDDNCNIVR